MRTVMYQPAFGCPGLVVLEMGSVRYYDLAGQTRWTIGRAASDRMPDIRLTSPVASRTHGEIVLVDGEWFYLQQSKTNGTLYNGTKIKSGLNGRIRPVLLKNGDVLRIDHSEADRADPRGVWMLFSTQSIPGKWAYYPLNGRSATVIGRDPGRCDLVQPLAYVSARHMIITGSNGRYYVSDCGSTAGTCLNGSNIYGPVCLKEKDWISVCDCHFIFTGAGLIYNDRSAG